MGDRTFRQDLQGSSPWNCDSWPTRCRPGHEDRLIHLSERMVAQSRQSLSVDSREPDTVKLVSRVLDKEPPRCGVDVRRRRSSPMTSPTPFCPGPGPVLAPGHLGAWVSPGDGARPGGRNGGVHGGTGPLRCLVSGSGLLGGDAARRLAPAGPQGRRRRHPTAVRRRGFDAVTISFGLRNVVDHIAGLREMARVTRPGGRLVVCEFSTPTVPVFSTVYKGT